METGGAGRLFYGIAFSSEWGKSSPIERGIASSEFMGTEAREQSKEEWMGGKYSKSNKCRLIICQKFDNEVKVTKC